MNNQLSLELSADTARNGVVDPTAIYGAAEAQPAAAVPPGYMAMYQVSGPADIPEALRMFKNRWGKPARLLVWPGCEFASDNGLIVESSPVVNKGTVRIE